MSVVLSRGLTLALLTTLAAAAWLAWHDDGTMAEPVLRQRAGAAPGSLGGAAPRAAAPAPTAQVAAWPSPALRSTDADPWPTLSGPARLAWMPPAPPPPVAAAAATRVAEAPAAPPPPPRFPYTFVGRWESASAAGATARPLVLLAGPQRSYAVGAGDVLEGQWRIEGVTAGAFTVTYLPQGSLQTVPFPRT